MLSFSHPYFRQGDFELASKMTCSGPGSASNRTTRLFKSPPGSNVVLRSTGVDLMVGATYPTATGGYQETEAINTSMNSSSTFVDLSATVSVDVMGQHRRRVFCESSLGIRRDPVLLSMFGNGGGVTRNSSGVLLGRVSTVESDSHLYQAPYHHHDPCHRSGGLQNRNTGMDSQHISALSSYFSTSIPFNSMCDIFLVWIPHIVPSSSNH
jgi:hypothetical protein